MAKHKKAKLQRAQEGAEQAIGRKTPGGSNQFEGYEVLVGGKSGPQSQEAGREIYQGALVEIQRRGSRDNLYLTQQGLITLQEDLRGEKTRESDFRIVGQALKRATQVDSNIKKTQARTTNVTPRAYALA